MIFPNFEFYRIKEAQNYPLSILMSFLGYDMDKKDGSW